jgi:fumarate reductase flavoprotein subunit
MKKLIIIIAICIVLSLSFIFINPFFNDTKTDVLVIGAGAAGMSAAIEAKDNGADVILVEKMPTVGGNTAKADDGINGSYTSIQELKNISDSKDIYLEDALIAGHDKNNRRLLETLVDNSAENITWLSDMGIDLTDLVLLAGHSYPRTHRPSGDERVGFLIANGLKNQVLSRGIDLWLETKAVDLLYDESGKNVFGATVETAEGKIINIKAKKTIIATGGFGGSQQVFVSYNESLIGYETTNQPGATGDFIYLTQNLDVEYINMSYIQIHPTVEPDYGVHISEAVRGNGGILIDETGKRFVNELELKDSLSKKLIALPSKTAYLFFDDKVRNSTKEVESYIADKIVFSANSIEGLAAQLFVDADILKNTINDYNNAVKVNFDSEFHRQNLDNAIEGRNYYAIKVWPGVYYCIGGLPVNENAQVLSKDNTPIQGLYAAGEATGGIHGEDRLGGNSLAGAVAFGRIAGKHAALN